MAQGHGPSLDIRQTCPVILISRFMTPFVLDVAWRFMSTSLGYMVPGDACVTRAFEEPCGSPTNSRDFSAWVSPASCIRIGRLVADPLQIPDIVSGWEFTCRQRSWRWQTPALLYSTPVFATVCRFSFTLFLGHTCRLLGLGPHRLSCDGLEASACAAFLRA